MGRRTLAVCAVVCLTLMADDLGRLPFAIGLSRKAHAIIRQNVWISLAVIALLILATTTGVIRIGPAVFVHEGSTLVVVGNALRLLRYDEPVAADGAPDRLRRDTGRQTRRHRAGKRVIPNLTWCSGTLQVRTICFWDRIAT